MDKITLNIGMENNPLTIENITYALSLLDTNPNMRLEMGEYNNESELTLVVSMTPILRNKVDVLRLIRNLAVITTQECIAVYDHHLEMGHLVKHPLHMDMEIEFDENYFIKY